MRIERATPDQAPQLFDIMVRATEAGCASHYPPDILAIWHQGRSVGGMAGVIADGGVYCLTDQAQIRGFVHLDKSEIVGLFVHSSDHRKGYGAALFRFAAGTIRERPVRVNATLNAVPFYEKQGCRRMGLASVRRHERDIYIMRMEWDA